MGMRMGHSQGWLSKIELGHRTLSLGDAYCLAKLIDVDPMQAIGPLSSAEKKQLDRFMADAKALRHRRVVRDAKGGAEKRR